MNRPKTLLEVFYPETATTIEAIGNKEKTEMPTKTKEQLRKEIDKKLNEEVNGSPLWECARGRAIIHELEKDLTSDRLIEIRREVKQMLFDAQLKSAGSSEADDDGLSIPPGGLRQKTEFRLCRYEFSREELAVIATEMADAVSQVAKKTDELKAVKSQIQSDIDQANATLRQKAEHMRSGFEMRSLDCEVVHFPKERMVRWYRIDTQEMVHERKMRPEELQEKLPLEIA